jgi:hypothetical protein
MELNCLQVVGHIAVVVVVNVDDFCLLSFSEAPFHFSFPIPQHDQLYEWGWYV